VHASYQAVVRTDQRRGPWSVPAAESGLVRITKTIISGCEPGKAQQQAAALAPAGLRDLAVQLAADPDLTVSVTSYEDGRQELKVMHAGGPQHTQDTMDRHWLTGRPEARTMSVTTPASLQDAVAAIRGIIRATATQRHLLRRPGNSSRRAMGMDSLPAPGRVRVLRSSALRSRAGACGLSGRRPGPERPPPGLIPAVQARTREVWRYRGHPRRH
jgi:hypothetical protein